MCVLMLQHWRRVLPGAGSLSLHARLHGVRAQGHHPGAAGARGALRQDRALLRRALDPHQRGQVRVR